MTEPLFEKQFEILGQRFGFDLPIDIKSDGFEPGNPNIRTTDQDTPARDGISMGVDRLGGKTWSFSLFTNCKNENEAWDQVTALQSAWENEDLRENPRTVTPLRYQLGGQVRRVYGRPRRFRPIPGETSGSGRIDIECDFDLTYPYVFDDEEQNITLGIAPVNPVSQGLTVPFTPPFTSEPASAETGNQITIEGDPGTRTPITVKFTAIGGSLTNASVDISDWRVALLDAVNPGNPVTVDARPWVMAATKQFGGSVKLPPRTTRLSRMWLRPGTYGIFFRGASRSGSGTVTVSWRNARRSPR